MRPYYYNVSTTIAETKTGMLISTVKQYFFVSSNSVLLSENEILGPTAKLLGNRVEKQNRLNRLLCLNIPWFNSFKDMKAFYKTIMVTLIMQLKCLVDLKFTACSLFSPSNVVTIINCNCMVTRSKIAIRA